MTQRKTPALHYGWIVVLVGMLVMFACLGLARFSFGILLPSMARALDLDYARQGYVGTGYFVGYLAMVALAPILSARVGNRSAIVLGLALIAASMSLLGAAGGYAAALACYTLTGVGSGAANIAMMALITNWFARSRRGAATGTVIAGNGAGVILSGVLVPWVVTAWPGLGWRAGWLSLGAMVGVVCVLAWALLRNTPTDMGLAMIGRMPNQEPSPPADPAGERPFLMHLGCIYFLFGLTYIVYGTFIVTTMIDEYGFGQGLAGKFWAWVGFFSLFSGPVLGRVSDRFGRKAGLVSAYAIQTAAYLLAGLGAPLAGAPALYGSVVLYGLAAWSIPTIMTATIADRLGPAGTARGFAFITFFFAIGQVAGPAAAGRLAEAAGGFSPAYTLSGVLTLAAIGLTLGLRAEPGPVARADAG